VSEARNSEQPGLLSVSRKEETLALRVYVWHVTRGGPATVRSSEEYRIQKMTRSPLIIGNGRLTLLLGWYEQAHIFVAWDAYAHQTARYSASIQVHAPYIEEARIRGMAIQHRGQPIENVIVVRSQLFSAYLEQARVIHGRQLNAVSETFPELDTQEIEDDAQRDSELPEPADALIPSAGTPRQRRQVSRTLLRWWRSSTFRDAVTWAYRYRCAACGIGLNLTEAAHIIPITDPQSSEHSGRMA